MTDRTYEIGVFDKTLYYEKLVQTGKNTPRYKRDQGLWDNNPFSKSSGYYNRTQSKVYDQPVGGNITNNGVSCHQLKPVIYNPAIYPADAEVLAKLSQLWRGTDINLGMYLSPEGRESVSLVADSLKRVTNAALSLKRGDFGDFVRNLHKLPRRDRRNSFRKFNQGDISGAFLSAHLGWEPLIKDAYTASKGIALTSETRRLTARKRGPARVCRIDSATPFAGSTLEVKQKTTLCYIVDIEQPPTFAEAFGMENPFLIAWELVPLSFVADYFLPISAAIDSLGFISSNLSVKGWRKTYARLDWEYKIPNNTQVASSWPFNAYVRPGLVENRGMLVATRTPWTPSFKDPFRGLRVKTPASVMRLSTLAALAHQSLLNLR